MMLTRNNYRRIITLGIVFLCLAVNIIASHSTSAVNYQTIDSSQLTELFSDSLSRSLQGATITKNYYIYTDWSCDGCKTNLIACKRSQPSSCKTLASGYWGHASTVYHKWGSNTVTVVGNGNQGYANHCINLNTGKEVSGCEEITPSGLGADGGDASDWLQGYTWYGDYALRGWGYSPSTGGVNKLLVYKDGLDTVYTLPSFIYEMEGVGVDGSTGEVVIVAKAPGRGTVKFYKISGSVLNLGSGATNEKREAKKSAAKKKDPADYQNTYVPSVSVYDGSVDTNFFGTLQDDSEGCGVYTVLDLVMTILTIGIGIAATIGIAVSGIIYLTAKGDVAKTTKAKRRILEIVIGLAAYAAIWAFLTFLLPEFNPELKACKTLTTEEIAARDAAREAKRAAIRAARAKANITTNNSSSASTEKCMKSAAKVVRNQVCKLKTPAERISTTAVLLAGSASRPSKKYIAAMNETKTNRGESGCRADGQACGMFVGTTVRAAGIDPKFPTMASRIYPYVKKSKYWKEVSTKNPKPGDVSLSYFDGGSAGHVSVYVKNKNGKTVTAQASLCDFYGVVEDRAQYTGGGNKTYRYVGK